MQHAGRPTIFLIAGEPSGDVLGAKLMRALRALTRDEIRFVGVGGTQMRREGLQSLFPMSDISLMGFSEIIPHIPKVMGRIRQTVSEIERFRPDMLITIDSPGFCKRVVKKVRKIKSLTMPIVHYVAPTVWAYRPERARSFAELYDHILLLLPFEPPYFDAVGLGNTYIGHPVVEDWRPQDGRAAFRRKHSISEDQPLLTLLPGSRKGEVLRLLPIYQETVALLKSRYPGLQVAMVSTPEMASQMNQWLRHWPVPVILVTNDKDKREAFAASDIALSKSGTVSLELALAGVPHVVTYKVSRFSAWAMRNMIKVRFVNLVNILHKKEIVPELLQEFCRPDLLAEAVDALLENPDEREWQIQKSWEALEMLGLNEDFSPSEKAGDVILNMLGMSPQNGQHHHAQGENIIPYVVNW